MDYEHTQSTFLPLILWIAFIAVILLISSLDSTEASVVAIMTGIAVFIGVLVGLFSRLTTTVRTGVITVAFGMGWPVRKIPLADVTDMRIVRNHWYHGWGIRWISNGWMYNVWGLDAVELDLANGKRFRIGTDEAANLSAALRISLDR